MTLLSRLDCPIATVSLFRTPQRLRSRCVSRTPRPPHAEPQTENKEPPEKAPLTETDREEDPVWVRREKMRALQKADSEGRFELPFFVSLPLSAVIAIAAVGSVFEIFNRHAVFGVIPPESPLWLPILLFFATTGLPVAGYFFFSAVAAANKFAEQMDEVDRA